MQQYCLIACSCLSVVRTGVVVENTLVAASLQMSEA
jgi:hypothetical protein